MILTVTSCDQAVFKKWDDTSLTNNIWDSGKEIQFNPEIEDITKAYSITIGIRHLYGLNLPELPLGVGIIAPSGATETKLYTIKLMDENNQPLASCSGSFCDLETEVEPSFTFSEKGKYTFIVQQLTGFEKLNGIMEVGLIIK